MYLGSWKIDDYLTFPVNTHLASTGAATDDDGVPSYRIYEDETTTAILNGSMAKLDDTNTTGFYSEQIQLTAANGFEAGKSYTIYIETTVSSVVHTFSHTFQMQAEVALHADWLNGGRLDLLIDAIKASTDDWNDGQRLDLLLDAIKLSTDDWIDGNRLDLLLDAIKVSTDDWLNDGRLDLIIDAIKASTDDWLNGQRLDLLLDAVKERTDNLPDDPADQSLIIVATDAIITRLAGMEGTGFISATDSLEAIRDRGDAGWITATPEGPGAIAWVYTLTNSEGGAPIEGAEVWITTDIGGGNTIANGVTDSFGQAWFMLDPGTYYVWRKKGGWNFDNPDTETVV